MDLRRKEHGYSEVVEKKRHSDLKSLSKFWGISAWMLELIMALSAKDVVKEPGEVLSSGSVARRGEGNGVVMLTGAKTYFGRTTEFVQEARPKLHIEAVVAKCPVALRHCRRAAGRSGRAVADPRCAVRRDDSAHARLADERSAGRSSRHVHGQHGSQVAA